MRLNKISINNILKGILVVSLCYMWLFKYAWAEETYQYYDAIIERIQPGEDQKHQYVEGIPIPLQEVCSTKADVTAFTYLHRAKLQENQMLMFLERDWRNFWSLNKNFTHATYVDMQRIVRDAYRKDKKGKYRVECCDNEEEIGKAKNELLRCLNFLHF